MMEEERNSENQQKTENYTQAPLNEPGTYGQESQMYAQNNYQDSQTYGQTPNQEGSSWYNKQPNYGNQNYANQPNYGNPNYSGQPNYGNQNYTNQQPGFYNNSGFGNQVQHGPVTDIFCYFLLIIMPLRIIIGFISFGGWMMGSIDYRNISNGTYLTDIMLSGTNIALTLFSYLLTVLFIIFIILDIVKINQQKYKITGLILFAILLNPGYYLWRAHVLGRKKTAPIIYTVAFSVLIVAYYIFVFFQAYMTVLRIVSYY